MIRNRRDASSASRVFWLLVPILTIGMLCVLPQRAQAAEEPSIDKTSIVLNTWQVWQTWVPATHKYKPDYSSWMPYMKFRVRGPLADGSQLSVEYTKPNGSTWVNIDVPTEEIKSGESRLLETPRNTTTDFEKKYIGDVGQYGYKIKLKNELTGTNSILCSGTFKVDRISTYNGTAITKYKYDYIVNYDWALPVGLVWLAVDNGGPEVLHCGLWFKNLDSEADLAGYIFYNGTEIGNTKKLGNATHVAEDIQTAGDNKNEPKWLLDYFEWYGVGRPATDGMNRDVFDIGQHPGTYTIKILRSGSLFRETSFKVGADGHIEHAITDSNDLNTKRDVVPVSIHGTTDGAWNKSAYKSGAFFGHPLKGFTAQ